MTLVLALCFLTFLASKQHYIGADARTAPSPGSAGGGGGGGGGGGVLTVFTPSPSLDVSICSDADCKADCIDELKENNRFLNVWRLIKESFVCVLPKINYN
ncbi:hypothetical protein D8674_031477 [Pyrus ussuriensis x Pyrus communis]|uniref:Uncharacterized protein n=1 Tax=Pyrus ussuriensis x Pyrus communis TaxID=2448454 RepID=A0A5N5EZ79_9ROSA|nr:hypothetical protein D8674_031477 [Pyrus ussuriensis x Pyrus communis]